nr:MAG TPA: hypothetical protein [Caudoviricetes sp.]
MMSRLVGLRGTRRSEPSHSACKRINAAPNLDLHHPAAIR